MKIAVVGSGISGMAAAYLLHHHHEVTLYEKDNTPGGHTRTLDIRYGEKVIPVDTGFIVFNHRNYPNLTGLFKHLGVETHASHMSFGVSIRKGWLEYAGRDIFSLFAQVRNVARPEFYRMLRDILRFNKEAGHLLKTEGKETLGEYLSRIGMGEWFRRYYLLPMGGAIWSCPVARMLDFPARTFVRFFHNHGLLTVSGQPQWHTVTGGSQRYVDKITAPLRESIRTGTQVTSITRKANKIQVTDATGATESLDHVVIAAHGDQALEILADASDEERNILKRFRYQRNAAILHRDASLMPKRRGCWASWNYLADTEEAAGAVSLTYWMNFLQGIDERYPLFVTLNPAKRPAPETIFDEHVFEHPLYDQAMIEAQSSLPLLQGKRNTWYCGAYHYDGFHEDGLKSAMDVAKALGTRIPWQ